HGGHPHGAAAGERTTEDEGSRPRGHLRVAGVPHARLGLRAADALCRLVVPIDAPTGRPFPRSTAPESTAAARAMGGPPDGYRRSRRGPREGDAGARLRDPVPPPHHR